MFRVIPYFLTLFVHLSITAKTCEIQGVIIDSESKEELPYVHIYFHEGNYGITSDWKGQFIMKVDSLECSTQIVSISHLGYVSRKVELAKLIKSDDLVIELHRDTQILSMVRVSGKSLSKVVLGKKRRRCKNCVAGWYTTNGHFVKEPTGERGALISNPSSKEYWLNSLHFQIEKNTYDSVLIRAHIYPFYNDTIGTDLLKENVYLKVDVEKGWVKAPLVQYNLLISSDIVISLEWVDSWGHNKYTGGLPANWESCLLLATGKSRGAKSFSKEYYHSDKWRATSDRYLSLYIIADEEKH